MKKSDKKQVLEFIISMHKAHDEIKAAVERRNEPLVQSMLRDLQELAVSFGEMLEKFEGEGFITVSYIEQYCESLFQIFEKLQKESLTSHKVYKQLEKYLLKIENSVKNDIKVRKEIAFFPYKASMWDSLESIYFRLKQDPDNDVYCVPIPYFEVNSDRSLGTMHYEGRQYPGNIEVIDWETYKFEERNPDEIYIHNPYDNWNLVTSIHPRFYSKNLKAHTEKLVYVPYFVMGEFDIDNEVITESKKHFCFSPGIIFADEVILESENIKKFYVREYMKAAKENGLTGLHVDEKYLNQKFKGIGSPKIEKVLRTKKEELDIPPKWLKVIQKEDGTWKKIILYNTGIAALLQHGEKWVDKIEDSLKIFKENKDNVTLLWRPHPLIETTMKSMRPQMLQKYRQIKLQYINEGWGIYDESTDLNRAVAVSDAYYGDQSSVVKLYQEVKKTVMIQNVDVIDQEEQNV